MIFFFSFAAAAQNNGPQEHGLVALRDNANVNLVDRKFCVVSNAVILSCPLFNQTLAIDGSVFLKKIEVRIRTCNSSLWPVFTYSNGTLVDNVADNLQCNTEITLGELRLFFDINVFLDTFNTTVIQTSVSLIML